MVRRSVAWDSGRMGSNIPTPHELAVFRVIAQAHPRWITCDDIARQASVAPRTARAHALKFVQLGIIERIEAFPANHYRLAPGAGEHEYAARLQVAAEVLDVELPALPS